MKCLDCGYNISKSEIDEHEGHEIVEGFFEEDKAMKTEDTVLTGCKVICLGEQPDDLIPEMIRCPLTQEDQEKCLTGRQYEAGKKAGIREVVEWINKIDNETVIPGLDNVLAKEANRAPNVAFLAVPWIEWQVELKKWGVE